MKVFWKVFRSRKILRLILKVRMTKQNKPLKKGLILLIWVNFGIGLIWWMNFVERHGQTTGKKNLKMIILRDSIITTSVTIITLSFAIDKVFQKVNGALHHLLQTSQELQRDLGLSPKKCCFYALCVTWNPTANDHSRLNWYYPPVGRSISQDGVQGSERVARADDVWVPYMESSLKRGRNAK